MMTPAALPFSPEKILDSIVESIICIDLDGLITYWNSGAERLYEYTAGEAVGRHYSMIYPDGRARDYEQVQGIRAAVIEKGRAEVEGWRLTKSGRKVFVRLTAAPIYDNQDRHVGFVGFAIDFTERKNVEDRLAESEARLREQLAFSSSLIEAQGEAGVGLMIVDQGRVIFANPAGCAIVGYSLDEVLAMSSFLELIAPADRQRVANNHQRRLRGDVFDNRYDTQVLCKDGAIRHVELAVALLPAGDHFSVLGVIVDITARKVAEERVQYLALHDPLTGLANRMLCFDRLNAAVAVARRRSSSFAVLYVDLDDFKPINDRHGHDAGDIALRTVAERLRACVRESDMVARTGGDEFILVVNDAHLPAAAVTVADKIIAALGEPLPLANCPETLGVSIGIAIYPMHGDDVDTLVHRADIAMYQAKHLGKNRCVVFGASQSP